MSPYPSTWAGVFTVAEECLVGNDDVDGDWPGQRLTPVTRSTSRSAITWPASSVARLACADEVVGVPFEIGPDGDAVRDRQEVRSRRSSCRVRAGMLT